MEGRPGFIILAGEKTFGLGLQKVCFAACCARRLYECTCDLCDGVN